MSALGIAFDPLVPPAVFIVLAAACTLTAAVALVRNPAAGAARALAFGALLLFLAGPERRDAETTPLADLALIVVDRSASQTLGDRAETTDAALARLEARLDALGTVERRVVTVDGAEETRLVEAVAQAAGEAPGAQLAAIFVVTDARFHDGDAARDRLRAATRAPVHILVTGAPKERDRKLTLTSAPRYGVVRESVRIGFRVDDVSAEPGPAAQTGAPVEVVLRVDGVETVRQKIPVGSEVAFDAPLERPGPLVVELEVEPLAGELTARNNIAVLPITAIRDRLRVLLISGEPHPGERVWRNLLKSDPAIDLVHFTILRPNQKTSDTALQRELALIEFPYDELFIDKLSEFDLLIFDRYSYRGVLNAFHFDNVARYVERGGAVLVASGPEYNGPLSLAAQRTLSYILPAKPTAPAQTGPYRPLVSPLGARHPVTADLPETDYWGRWLRIMPVNVLSGDTLMQGPEDDPLLVLDRVGDGRVGLLLSDHVWLWARGFDGGGPHGELLRRVAHWLMKEPELEEERLLLRPQGRDLVVERRTLDAESPPVDLTGPDGSTAAIAMAASDEEGLFRAVVPDAPRGLYRARSGDLFAVGTVGVAAAPEFQDVVADMAAAETLAQAGDGGAFRLRRSARAGVDLPALRRVRDRPGAKAGPGWAGLEAKDAERVDAVSTAPVAPPGAWLAAVGAALALGWRLEGGRRPQKDAKVGR
ncbi:MAG: hypothetical protein AAGC56_02670 [Pseudomonadota bacterium]